ncbi:hypothetical protein GCM10019814_12380 [Lactococcus raffinolactis]|nr:TaqI-like C-terminal specificity domain-containing protein [Lactococcus raffinolactis]PCS10370.1 type IIS restriction/modification enzyme [Lactococcus raffinolactis]
MTTQDKLEEKTRANQFKNFFELATLAMREKGQTSSEVDFIIVIGQATMIIFDSADYRRRLILTVDKISRANSKYLDKFDSLKSDVLVEKNVYQEDEDFGDVLLADEFKIELFRFAISDDEQFVSKTRILRLNFWKKIQDEQKCQKIIKDIFFKNLDLDMTSQYYADVISAVLDTLVLRYLLVRILEGRFGYEIDRAKKSVLNVGLGTSIDKALENNVKFNQQEIEILLNKPKKMSLQISLFDDFEAMSIDEKAIQDVKEKQAQYMEEIYGGDLYVSDIAKAATEIEKTLTEEQYALSWGLTSSTNLDFDLADITPGTIGEQYEQTLKMSLVKGSSGNWEYSKDNTQQKDLGAFYTNAKITDYIIDITLGKKLEEIKQSVIDAPASQKEKVLRSVLDLRMADITSGGGTFLAGAVRKLGNWYVELEKTLGTKQIIAEIKTKALSSMAEFQKYAINNMIYGVDVDLKALIVSSFALTLESLGDEQDKLPELIGKTLINQNSVISLVPEDKKLEMFKTYKADIMNLVEEKKKWASKGEDFQEKRLHLEKIFATISVTALKSKKISDVEFLKTFDEKNMGVLEFSLPEIFFDREGNYTGGFDIIFGNPPYIQLQKKEIFSDTEKEVYKKLGEFESYEATGDIYTLFFERAIQLLKPNGKLGFITSNKYMRSGYGKSLRNYFLGYTNPYLLINLGSGMFGATVDTSILALDKSDNKDELEAIDLVKRAREPRKRIENMSDYIEQNKLNVSYQKDESWTILSPIEQSIKQKIESVGTPLKDWDISINYGIKTGFNEAFIVSEEKRQEILDNCRSYDERTRTAELIRPILRGKDIKRYSYEFADKYLITTYNEYKDSTGNKVPSIDINNYPAIKSHLDIYLEQISKRQDKGDTPYNLRRCAYMDDFSKPKIIWKVIGNQLAFAIDNNEQLVNNACYILTGNFLEYLVIFLNSKAIYWYSDITNMNKTGMGDVQIGAQNIALFPIPKPNNQKQQPFIELLNNITTPTNNEQDQKSNELKLIDLVNNIYGFSLEETDFLNNYEG